MSSLIRSTKTYKLLKDLPLVKAGRLIIDEGLFVFKEPTTAGERMYRFRRDVMNTLPEWFEKIQD